MEPIYQKAEDGEISEGLPDYDHGWDDSILYLEDGEVFSGGSACELL